jgi:hypothetical protein
MRLLQNRKMKQTNWSLWGKPEWFANHTETGIITGIVSASTGKVLQSFLRCYKGRRVPWQVLYNVYIYTYIIYIYIFIFIYLYIYYSI